MNSSGGKHPSRETTFISRTKPFYGKIIVLCKILYSTLSFHKGARSVRFIHPNIIQERIPKLSSRYFKLFNCKNVQVVAPLMSFNIELWRPRQPLIFPLIQAPSGGLRSVKHERRDVIIRVRGYGMTKFRDSFRRCKHNKACS